MSIITGVIVGIITFTNIIPAYEYDQDAKRFLGQAIWANKMTYGDRPNLHELFRKQPLESRNMFNYSNTIEIYLDQQSGIAFYLCDREDLLEEEFVADSVKYVMNKNKDFGIYNSYYYMYQNNRIFLLDNTINFQMRRQTLFYSLSACLIAWIILFFVSRFVIGRMLKPVQESIENQRRFISDAGHELKTPISVISANASVLESEIGNNKWLSYIEKETDQMEYLVKELMTLSQMEDSSNTLVKSEFNLSKCVLKACLPFESLAFEANTKLELLIDENISFIGDANKMNQLVTIFLSNALKYGKENGEIRVKLFEQNKKITLSVYNTGQGVSEAEKEKIFERFYRVDKARSRKEGSHGLGLAIAKAIVENHGGQIVVNSKENEWIEFNVQLPKK
ncbi:MAG: GHKL domain-containing protein [Firmicutes bacterium]|nr:GHKL domain-containing protein [Bacillota bacterium]